MWQGCGTEPVTNQTETVSELREWRNSCLGSTEAAFAEGRSGNVARNGIADHTYFVGRAEEVAAARVNVTKFSPSVEELTSQVLLLSTVWPDNAVVGIDEQHNWLIITNACVTALRATIVWLYFAGLSSLSTRLSGVLPSVRI